MEEFKVIKEESYESIAGYLNKICQHTNIIHPLAFIYHDKKRYMITELDEEEQQHEGKGYAIVLEENGNYRLFGTFYDDTSFAIVDDKNKSYRISTTDDKKVTTLDNNNRFEEVFYPSSTIQDRPQEFFYYAQQDPYNRREVAMTYMINEAHTPDRAVPYLRGRNPDNIMINQAGWFFNHPIDYGCFFNRYYRYMRLNNDYVKALEFLKSYSDDGMKAYIRTLGFNSSVPQEIIDLYMGNHSEVKVLKKVTDKYIENTNK